MEPIRVRVALIGETGCGKTSLYRSFKGLALDRYVLPTTESKQLIVDNEVDGRNIRFHIWDTNGKAGFNGEASVHFVLACFAVDNRMEFSHVRMKYLTDCEIDEDVSLILVGTKQDLVVGAEAPVTYEEGRARAKQMGATSYMTCSAKTRVGIVEIFEAMARHQIAPNQSVYAGFCNIL